MSICRHSGRLIHQKPTSTGLFRSFGLKSAEVIFWEPVLFSITVAMSAYPSGARLEAFLRALIFHAEVLLHGRIKILSRRGGVDVSTFHSGQRPFYNTLATPSGACRSTCDIRISWLNLPSSCHTHIHSWASPQGPRLSMSVAFLSAA